MRPNSQISFALTIHVYSTILKEETCNITDDITKTVTIQKKYFSSEYPRIIFLIKVSYKTENNLSA